MKKTLFLLSVAFLLMAATPAWPANTNYPMPEQKWPDTVQAWPTAGDIVACDFSYPLNAWPTNEEAWPTTSMANIKADNYPVAAWPSNENAWPYPCRYPFPANTGYPYPLFNVA